jgi:DNA invertase Pin-like site-specific DNA recombinase
MRKGRTQSSEPRTIGYLRVSTDSQDPEICKTSVRAFANEKGFGKVEFVEEIASGAISWKERKIRELIESLKPGDRLIVPELSRLGRSMLDIMTILQMPKEKNISIYDIKGNWKLDDSLQSKVVAMCFSIAAEIERDLISRRTREGIAAARLKGNFPGRPKGPGKSKLDKHKEEIIALLKTGSRQSYISKRYGCTPATLCNWLKKNKIDVKEEFPEAISKPERFQRKEKES